MARRAKQAEARAKQEHFWCNEMVKKMVNEMVKDAPAAYAVGSFIKEVVEESA